MLNWRPKHQKYKGRVVLRGDIVKDNSGSYAVFTEQGSSASVSDRTGRPVGDRPGRPGEHRNSEAQIRTLLDKQKRANSCSAKQELISTNFKQLEPKKFNNEINNFLQGTSIAAKFGIT